MAKKIQLRRDTLVNWERINPKLAQGEIGVDLTNKNFKIGDGENTWTQLNYAVALGRFANKAGKTYVSASEIDEIDFYNEDELTVRLTKALFEIQDPVNVSILSEEASVDEFTGALTVAGGVGIQGDLNVAGKLNVAVLDLTGSGGSLETDLTGNVTGNVTGDIRGDVYSNNGVRILNNGTNGFNALFTGNVTGDVTSTGVSSFSDIDITGGKINGTIIGATTPATIKGTTITATTGFSGNLTGNVTGNITGNITGDVTGNLTGNVTGNVTGDLKGDVYASNGTSKVLENGNGTNIPATFTGNIIGDIYASDGVTKIFENGSDGTNAVFTGTVNTASGVTGKLIGDVYAADGTSKILENGLDGTNAIFTGSVNSNKKSTFNEVTIFSTTGTPGLIDNTEIGKTIPFRITGTTITGTTITATEKFVGTFQGNSSGNVTGDVTGNLKGDILATNGIRVFDNGIDGTDAVFTGLVSGNVTSTGLSSFNNIAITGGSINTATIGATTPSTITGTTITATTGFSGNLTGNVTGNVTGNLTGNVTGNLTGNVTGNVTGNLTGNVTSTGSSSFSSITVTGGNIDSTAIGATTPTTVKGTTITATTGFSGDLTGNVTSTGTSSFSNVTITGGSINTTTIGASNPTTITGTTITATTGFSGNVTGNVTGNLTGNVTGNLTGNVTGNVTGNLTGNVTSTGTSSFSDIDVTGGKINNTPIGATTPTTVKGTTITATTGFSGDLTGNVTSTGSSSFSNIDVTGGKINSTPIGATTPSTVDGTTIKADEYIVNNAGLFKFKSKAPSVTSVNFKSPDSLLSSYNLTLPPSLGLDGYVLGQDATGQLEFVSPDAFGGGKVNVSNVYGDDANDGINKPVKTVKRALQIASGIVYNANGKTNDKKLVISVANGEYYEDNPIIIPDNVSVQGAGLRACNIRPLNANLDMLRVRNGCYFTAFTFRDNLNVSGAPQFTFDYAVSFDDPTDVNCDRTGYTNMPATRPTITISPYIQNCSIISFLGGNGVLVDGSKVNTPNKPKNPIEVENPAEGPEPEQGKSMVSNAFTMLSFGGTGWRVINDAYAQIVSCFQIFCLNGSYCQSGGYLSITNSATNFGKYALRASGYSPNAFSFNRGVVVGTGTAGAQQTIQAIGFGQLPVQDYVIRFRDTSYKNTYFNLLENKSFLETQVINWIETQISGNISPFTSTFAYNRVKCRRDIGLLVEAVANDVLTGGNSRSVEAGLSYATAGVAALTSQKTQNIAAFQKLKTEAMAVIQDLGIDFIVEQKFNIIIGIINDPTTAPVSISFSNVGDISANYQPIVASDYVNFNAATGIKFINNEFQFEITAHGLLSGQKIIYNNLSETTIPGLNNEQTYYVELKDANHFGLFYDNSLTTKVKILGASTGSQRFVKNIKEFYVDTIVDNHTDYQKLTLAPNTYIFETGREIEGLSGGSPTRAYVYTYDPFKYELIVSLDYVTVDNIISRRPFSDSGTINNDHAPSPDTKTTINIVAVESINTLYTVNIKILPVTNGTQLINLGNLPKKQIWLHRPSIVNSSSHSWEYAGSGTDYNALPQNGGKGDPQYEQFGDRPGRVYTSGTNELGDFKVGTFIKAENKTGNVTFTNTVTIGALAALKLAVGNVTIDEFSTDIGLGDNEVGGPKDTRLSTQLATRSFLANRLGEFIDKKISTNNVSGAIPQLNSLGQLNADIIPPVRNFLSYRSQGYDSRLVQVQNIPPVNLLNGDLAIETYSTLQLTLNRAITATDGTIIVQNTTGAKGVIVGSIAATTLITVGSYLNATFNAAFNTTDTLIIGGDSTPSDSNQSVTPTNVGTITTGQTVNYILSEQEPSQFLVLDPSKSYDFTGITSVVGANQQSIGTITGTAFGVLYSFDNANIVGGTGYRSGVYTNVPLISANGSPTGTGALADITVTSGSVTNVNLLRGGTGYAVNDLLSASPIDIGGIYDPANQFNIRITGIQKRLYVDIVGAQKFVASSSVPEYIYDNNALVNTLTLTSTIAKSFNAATVGGNVDYINSRITINSHGLTNGDPVKYTSSPYPNIGGLVGGSVYYIKVYDSNTIELCTDYSIQNKIAFVSSGTGNQSLTLSAVDLIRDSIYLPSHGFSTGNSICLTGSALPNGLPSNTFYFIGSVTTNSFTLHQTKADAFSSVNGQTINALNFSSAGTGSATFRLQNVQIIGTINTGSQRNINWSSLSANNIDTSNIISGIINSSRLATGTANTSTFLRGDSSWSRAVQTLKASSPLTLTGSFFTDGSDNKFYDDVALKIDPVDGTKGDTFYTNSGVVSFIKSQFSVSDGIGAGKVFIKDNVIDAASVNGNNSSYLLDSQNHTIQPVNKGGTNLTTYATGDIIYANASSSFGKLNIGAINKVLVSTGSAPSWSDTISIKGLTVNGDVNFEGGIVSINSGKIKISDKNIEVGVVSALSSLTGVIADAASLTTITGLASTAGITGGMLLTKVSGTGAFGPNARVVDILSNTSITVQADSGNTVGSITFNLGGVTEYTADGAGITVKGTTDKTFTWKRTTTAWTSNDNLDLDSSKVYKIAGTEVLSASSLGTAVTGSSLTSVGTIGTGVWQGTIVNPTYGGTGVNNGANTLTIAGNVSHAGAFTQTFTATANTSVTLPITGTLATLAETETFTNKSLTSPTITGTGSIAAGVITLDSETVLIDSSTLTTATKTVDQVLASVSATKYRTVEFTISVTSGAYYQAIKILVVHDGSVVFLTQYGEILTNPSQSLATFTADILANNIRLLTTPVLTNTTYKVSINAISV